MAEKKAPSTRARSAKTGQMVTAAEAEENPDTTVTETVDPPTDAPAADGPGDAPAEEATAEKFVFPEELTPDYHPYQLKLRIYAKHLDAPASIKGVEGKVGDYVFQASDGGVGILTPEELAEHYEPSPPSPAAPA